jgi:predicted DNA-binding protein
MNRILVDLLPEQIEGLNQLKKMSKRTRAVLIREAVAQYLAASSKTSSVATPKSDAFAA